MAELWNDLLYTDIMQSDGYVVDYAVLTTYSLDMPSLLSIPFTLGTMCDLSEAALRSPHLVLEAINKATGKFSVFCNAGSIAVPQNYSKIYTLLERSVFQVSLERKGAGFINFHPKVWVIKETNPDTGESQIKVVVLSRNLTCSNDLDVVCELTGKIRNKTATRKARIKHKPLSDFLLWLSNRCDRKSRKNIKSIIEDIQYIEKFELHDSPFEDYDFFPMGIEGYDGIEQCLNGAILDHAAEIIVISPFVDNKTLISMTTNAPKAKKTLITRHSSINNEILSLFNDGVYVPKEVLTDKVEKDITVDLHEKVYFVRNYQTCYNTLYLGSTNATQNGFGRNVEFLLRLNFAPYKSSYDKFRNELLFDGKECMFEKVNVVPTEITPKENITDELNLRKAISAILKANANKHGEVYSITLHCNNKLPQIAITIHPMGLEAKKCILQDGIEFTQLELSMLTEFFVISIGDIKRIIKIEVNDLPVEERDTAIFRSIINTKHKFISYLAFMLTDDVEQYILECQQLEKDMKASNNIMKEQELSVSLYEDMVRMSYTNPEKITDIRTIIERADKSVIPEHFKDMYDVFENVIKQIRRL